MVRNGTRPRTRPDLRSCIVVGVGLGSDRPRGPLAGGRYLVGLGHDGLCRGWWGEPGGPVEQIQGGHGCRPGNCWYHPNQCTQMRDAEALARSSSRSTSVRPPSATPADLAPRQDGQLAEGRPHCLHRLVEISDKNAGVDAGVDGEDWLRIAGWLGADEP